MRIIADLVQLDDRSLQKSIVERKHQIDRLGTVDIQDLDVADRFSQHKVNAVLDVKNVVPIGPSVAHLVIGTAHGNGLAMHFANGDLGAVCPRDAPGAGLPRRAIPSGQNDPQNIRSVSMDLADRAVENCSRTARCLNGKVLRYDTARSLSFNPDKCGNAGRQLLELVTGRIARKSSE